MAAAPLPSAGQTNEVRLIGTVVVVVGCVVVVVVPMVVVVVARVVVVTTVLVVVEVGVVEVVVVVDGGVVVVVVVVVVGGTVAHEGRTGDVAIAGVSFTGSSTRSPLRPAARTAERRIQVGDRYFTEQT